MGRWVTDRRGKTVELLDPMMLQLLRRDHAIDQRTLDRMMNHLEPGLAGRSRKMFLSLALGLAVAGAAFTVLWLVGGRNFRTALTQSIVQQPWIFLPAVFGTVVVPIIAARKRHGRRVPGLLLRYKRCPHCGYDLQGAAVDESDGATVCPECGCAWDLASAPAVAVQASTLAPAERSPVTKLVIAGSLLLGLAVLGAMLTFGWWSSGWLGAGRILSLIIVLGVVVIMLAAIKRGSGCR